MICLTGRGDWHGTQTRKQAVFFDRHSTKIKIAIIADIAVANSIADPVSWMIFMTCAPARIFCYMNAGKAFVVFLPCYPPKPPDRWRLFFAGHRASLLRPEPLLLL